jgi:hypothetical protein
MLEPKGPEQEQIRPTFMGVLLVAPVAAVVALVAPAALVGLVDCPAVVAVLAGLLLDEHAPIATTIAAVPMMRVTF